MDARKLLDLGSSTLSLKVTPGVTNSVTLPFLTISLSFLKIFQFLTNSPTRRT